MSHSPDLACWRWTKWLRCSSADSGNSSIFIFRPCDAYFLLNASVAAFWLPDVSLPRQKVTVPLAPLASASVGAFCDPSGAPVLAEPPLEPPPPSSPPHPATTSAAAA